MITLRWVPLPQADVVSYRVYRSIIGFTAPLPSPAAAAGLTLVLAMNGQPPQTVTFGGASDVVTQINAVLAGGRAYLSLDFPATFFVRSDVRSAPGSLQIVGGTAMALLDIMAPRTVTEKSESQLLATIPALVDQAATVSYVDNDGTNLDWYQISTVDHLAAESLPSAYQQPITTSASLCVIEGVVVDLQGRRIVDARVTATLMAFPDSPAQGTHVTTEPITTLTGQDGRYSLAVIQGATIKLEIPAIGLMRNVTVPTGVQYVFASDLLASTVGTISSDAYLGVT